MSDTMIVVKANRPLRFCYGDGDFGDCGAFCWSD